jgi:hypothetical protein
MSKRPVQRQSQLITTFGPGAMVDLPTRSVLIGGLDRWHIGDGYTEVHEPALVRALENGLRKQGRWEEGRALRLLMPPVAQTNLRGEPPGVDVTVFPTWFVCERVETPTINGQQRRGRRMVRWCDLDPAGGRRKFQHDDGKKDDVTPLRFVGACEKGHLQDIDWRHILHPGEPCQEPMWLTEEGTSANLADLEIVCRCGLSLSLRDATKPGFLRFCEGQQPWLASDAREDCGRTKLRLLTRSATNAYFPQVISVISLPPDEDALFEIVERHWAALCNVDCVATVGMARQLNPAFRDDARNHSDEDIFDRIQRMKDRQGASKGAQNPKIAEFDILASGRDWIGANSPGARLYAETLPRDAWAKDIGRDLGVIRNVVAVHRLREVMCLYGFTRFEPASTAADDELEDIQLAVSGAPIGRHADWLPAIEQFGEGIFIHFDPDRIEAWHKDADVGQRISILEQGFSAHKRKYPALTDDKFPGGPYVLLHSLAHALITEIALDCGYPASSIKERIYAFPGTDSPKYGILIYTASTGAQGTLGGLVATAKGFSRILHQALDRITICSNDPVCADHEPGSAVDERALLGAACHGCLLIAETSCERRNQFLDRALLVDTMVESRSALW